MESYRESPESIETREKENQLPKIYFEPGFHPNTLKGIREIEEQFLLGNLDLHIWNRAVTARLQSYQPELIAIDSLMPLCKTGFEEFVWISLPARPSLINPNNVVYVLAGDISFCNGTFDPVTETAIKKVNQNRNWKASLEPATGAMLSGMALAFSQMIPTINTKTLDRRLFLKRGINILATLWLGRSVTVGLAPILAGFTNSTEVVDWCEKIYNNFPKLILDSEIVTGRTALLIAKEEESLNLFSKEIKTPGAVVMGNSHLNHVNTFLYNPQARANAIKQLAGLYMEIITSLNLSKQQEILAKESWLNFMTRTEIIRVEDPLKPLSSPIDEISNYVTKVYSFHSSQVEEAVKVFRHHNHLNFSQNSKTRLQGDALEP